MQEICYRGVGRAGRAKGGKEGVCGGARRRKGFVTQRSGSCLWAGAQEAALRHLWTGAATAGAILLQVRRSPEAGAPLVLLEPVECAVACSPSQWFAAAADRPEAGESVVCLFLPPVSSLGQNLMGGRLAKESGKYIQWFAGFPFW